MTGVSKSNRNRHWNKETGMVLATIITAGCYVLCFAQEGPPPQILLDNAHNYYNLATYKRESGEGDPSRDYRTAIENYVKYLAVDTAMTFEDSTAVFEKLGECHFFLTEYPESLRYFQWVIDRKPENAYMAGAFLFAGYAVWQTEGLTAAIP